MKVIKIGLVFVVFDVEQEPVSLQDSNLARSLMNLVEILMKDIPAEDNKYMKSWLIVSLYVLFSASGSAVIPW